MREWITPAADHSHDSGLANVELFHNSSVPNPQPKGHKGYTRPASSAIESTDRHIQKKKDRAATHRMTRFRRIMNSAQGKKSQLMTDHMMNLEPSPPSRMSIVRP